MLSLHVTSLYMCLWNWDEVGKTWDGGNSETCFCIQRTGGISTFGIERRERRSDIGGGKVKCIVGNLNAIQATALGVQMTVDFYHGFWSPAKRLKSPSGVRLFLSRGDKFFDGDFDDNTHDDILFEECLSKWDSTWPTFTPTERDQHTDPRFRYWHI